MAESLYTTQTPDSADNAEDTYTMGTEMVFAVDGTITAVRWRSATNAIGTSPSALVYNTAGTLLASKAAGVLTPGGVWNTITLDTPLAVTAGTYYVPAIGPINRYSALGGMHASGNVTNGNITAPQNGVGGHKNGRFAASAVATFPNSSGGAGYFVDVLFEAAETEVFGAGASAAIADETAVGLVRTFGVGASAGLSVSTAAGLVIVYAAGLSAAVSTDTALVIADTAGRPVVTTSAAFPIVTTSR